MSAKQTTELDADIVAAFEALDATTPESDLDGFEDRLLARLEEEDMSEISNETTTAADGQISAALGNAERQGSDDTELRDIKALARSTKLRISQRMSAQIDAQEPLLSASSLALRTISLPEPGQDYESVSGGAKPAASAAVHDEDTGLPAWIYAAISAVAAAAIVFFILRGQKPEQPQVALNEPLAVAPADPLAQTGSGLAQPGTATRDTGGAGGADTLGGSPGIESDTAGGAGGDGDNDGDQAGADGLAKDSSAADKGAATSARSSGATDGAARSARRAGAGTASKKAGPDADKSAAATTPSDDSAATADKVKAAKKPAKKPDALEDLLAEASGGAAGGNTGGNTGAGQQAGAAETRPTRTKLERGDIKKAMTPIGPKAQACYDKTQLSGMVTVMIELRVEPSGAISSASATGKFKGTPTGDCVASAAKAANLPAYDGAPMTFSYPFLLTQ